MVLEPVVMRPAAPVVLTGATAPERVAAREALETALARSGPDLARLCGAEGDLPVELIVAPGGAVGTVLVDPRALSRVPGAPCVEEALGRIHLPHPLDQPARLRTTVPLGDPRPPPPPPR